MAARRSYTKEEREAVLADVPALGINAAATKHGIPQTTLSKWAQVAGVRREVEPAPSSPKAKTRAPKTTREGARAQHKRKREEKKTREGQVAAAESARRCKVGGPTRSRA
jgi:transposase-like protein